MVISLVFGHKVFCFVFGSKLQLCLVWSHAEYQSYTASGTGFKVCGAVCWCGWLGVYNYLTDHLSQSWSIYNNKNMEKTQRGKMFLYRNMNLNLIIENCVFSCLPPGNKGWFSKLYFLLKLCLLYSTGVSASVDTQPTWGHECHSCLKSSSTCKTVC